MEKKKGLSVSKILPVLTVTVLVLTFVYAFVPSLQVSQTYVERMEAERKEKNDFLKADSESPLSSSQKKEFEGLKYFAPNEDFRFEATLDFEPFRKAESVILATSTGEQQEVTPKARAKFTKDGVQVSIILYALAGESDYFLPFRDATTGKTTYPAGRYLEIEKSTDNTVILDFNKAYNPYCAYSDKYSCPLPPQENHLPIAIEAGEKIYK
ncbi:MAG: DUF1684 domain-containing protein [Bacteroidota bacterium]